MRARAAAFVALLTLAAPAGAQLVSGQTDQDQGDKAAPAAAAPPDSKASADDALVEKKIRLKKEAAAAGPDLKPGAQEALEENLGDAKSDGAAAMSKSALAAPGTAKAVPAKAVAGRLNGSSDPSAFAPGAAVRTPVAPSVSADAPAPAARARGSRAYRRAERAAEGFKRDPSDAAETTPPGGDGKSASIFGDWKPSLSAKSSGGGDPSRPTNQADLLLAARSGFGDAFRAADLRPGRAPGGGEAVVERDGTPASPERLEALAEAIRAEPAALMRRPDFFQVLPREKFDDLKRDYETDEPETKAAEFRDMTMTAGDRDFRWSASCGALSDGCNPAAAGASYKKGDEVPPEDLGRAWSGAHGSDKAAAASDEDDDDDDEAPVDNSAKEKAFLDAQGRASDRFAAARRGAAGLLARLKDLAGFGGFDGGASAAPVGGESNGAAKTAAVGGFAETGPGGAFAGAVRPGGTGSVDSGAAASRGGRIRARRAARPPRAPTEVPVPERGAPRAEWLFGALVVGVVAVFLGARKRSTRG